MPQNLLEVRPAVLMAVPRIFEKIYAKVRDAVNAGRPRPAGWCSAGPRAPAAGWCATCTWTGARPGLLRLAWQLADRLLLSKVRAKTGGRLRFCVSGGAALNPQIMEFFWAMGVPIYEGYGLTETSPILTLNRLGRVRPGYVGHAHPQDLERPALPQAGRGRRDPLPGPQRHAGLLEAGGGHPGGVRRGGLLPHRRRGRDGPPGPGAGSPTARRRSSSPTAARTWPPSPSRTSCGRTSTSSRPSWWATTATTWPRSSCPTSPPCAPGASAST